MKLPLNKERNVNNFRYVLVLLILIPLFLLLSGNIRDILSGLVLGISAPFLTGGNHLNDGLASLLVGFDEKQELSEQNKLLKERVNLSKLYKIENEFLRDEVSELKKILGRNSGFNILPFSEEGEFYIQNIDNKFLLGYVLGGPASPPYDTLIIDIGRERVSVGELVSDNNGFVVGEVVETGSSSSKVKLFSSYGKKTDVFLGENKIMVSLTGAGSGNFFTVLPKDFPIKTDDIAIYPTDVTKIMALVDSVEYNEGESTKRVLLKSPFNVKNTRMVVVLNKKSGISN